MRLKRFIEQQEEKSERCGGGFGSNCGQNEELYEAFKMFEINRKGRMWGKDLGKLLRCIGWNPSESDLAEARKELETKMKGQVFFHDIERYVAQRDDASVGCAETDLQEAFSALDKSGSGKINVNDFRHFMTTLGEKMAPDEVDEMLKEAKATERDSIDYRLAVNLSSCQEATQHIISLSGVRIRRIPLRNVLLAETGIETILGSVDTEAETGIEKIVGSVHIEAGSDKMKAVVSEMKGKDLETLIAADQQKLASVSSGGGVAAAAAVGAPAAPAKEEAKKEVTKTRSRRIG